MVAIVVCHTGSESQADADLAPLRGLGTPIADLVARKSYCAQQSMLDATQPKGLHYYWKSEFVRALTPESCDVFRTYGMQTPTPQSQIVFFHVGGAIAERPADDGAVGNRDAEFAYAAAGCWLPEDTRGDAHRSWVRAAWHAMQPHSTGGVYVNFLTAEEGEDRVRAAYRDNFERLAAVKAAYDPENLFRSNKNVAPKA
jgi:hypothetical protein